MKANIPSRRKRPEGKSFLPPKENPEGESVLLPKENPEGGSFLPPKGNHPFRRRRIAKDRPDGKGNDVFCRRNTLKRNVLLREGNGKGTLSVAKAQKEDPHPPKENLKGDNFLRKGKLFLRRRKIPKENLSFRRRKIIPSVEGKFRNEDLECFPSRRMPFSFRRRKMRKGDHSFCRRKIQHGILLLRAKENAEGKSFLLQEGKSARIPSPSREGKCGRKPFPSAEGKYCKESFPISS